MFDPIVGIIGAALYLLGFATCAILCIGKQSDKPISCEICKHSKGGRCDYHNANCAKCLIKGAFTGFERGGKNDT
jgi:hypothetical protein